LRYEEIQSLACEDLFIIDRLWTIYSQGRFGFSVQKRIWESLGSEKPDRSRGEEFSERVGWHKQQTEADNYYDRDHLYTIKRRKDIPCGLNAPEGNLPSICEFGGGELLSWYDPPDTESIWVFTGLAAIEINGQKTRFLGQTWLLVFSNASKLVQKFLKP
jgi:hypothetical protein